MSDRTPIPLVAFPIPLDSPEFAEICGWPFTDPFVSRLLRDDIPQRVQFGDCRVWGYRDPDGRLVGFGTLDVCDDYGEFTSGKAHPYIPLLANNPSIKLGQGETILKHLIGEAALLACGASACHDVLYLDVYTTSTPAINLYRRCQFEEVTPDPIPDPQDGGKAYFVMRKRVSISAS